MEWRRGRTARRKRNELATITYAVRKTRAEYGSPSLPILPSRLIPLSSGTETRKTWRGGVDPATAMLPAAEISQSDPSPITACTTSELTKGSNLRRYSAVETRPRNFCHRDPSVSPASCSKFFPASRDKNLAEHIYIYAWEKGKSKVAERAKIAHKVTQSVCYILNRGRNGELFFCKDLSIKMFRNFCIFSIVLRN